MQLSEEQILIQQTAQDFALQELSPLAAAFDRGEKLETFKQKLQQLAELGFMGLNISADYGGTEAGSIAFSLAITELAKGCASTAVTVSVTNMVAEVIQTMGTEQQKQTYLPKICSGEYLAGGFCLTETNAGSDPSAMTCSAKLVGDEFILNGSKQFITSAEYAGVFVVWAVTDPTAKRGQGISCFIVDKDRDGIEIAPKEHKMGQTASATNAVHFNNCRIPKTALLGELHDGYRIAVTELTGGRIGIGSLALGIGIAAMDYAKAYIKERQQFGKPLASFQGLQWQLADRYTELEAARLLLLNAAQLKESGAPYAKNASMAKLFASESANKACYDALQMLGGYGYIKEYPLERFARDVRITSIYEGTSEIQRLIIARELLND